jgi:hypothetical protein
MPYSTPSHLHIVHSTDNEEVIRVSGPLAAAAAPEELTLGYPEEFEAVLRGSRQWDAAEHGTGQWTSIGWCLGACAETTSLLHAFTYFPWLADEGGVKFPPSPQPTPDARALYAEGSRATES